MWALGAVISFTIVAATLQSAAGIPWEATYRVACGVSCLVFIWTLIDDHPDEGWLKTSFWLALVINIGILFTPLVDRPASRGELMLFALPDAIVVLVARLATYRVSEDRQRVLRAQLIFGLFVAMTACAILFTFVLVYPNARRP